MPRSTPHWTFTLRERRDVLIVRQRARQVAHLLQYSPLEQACIAAGVFLIADQARRAYSAPEIRFQLEGGHLEVSAGPTAESLKRIEEAAPLRLSKPLPEAARKESPDDLCFLIARINDQTPRDLYGEMVKQNEDVLQLLHLLRNPEERGESNFSASA